MNAIQQTFTAFRFKILKVPAEKQARMIPDSP